MPESLWGKRVNFLSYVFSVASKGEITCAIKINSWCNFNFCSLPSFSFRRRDNVIITIIRQWSKYTLCHEARMWKGGCEVKEANLSTHALFFSVDPPTTQNCANNCRLYHLRTHCSQRFIEQKPVHTGKFAVVPSKRWKLWQESPFIHTLEHVLKTSWQKLKDTNNSLETQLTLINKPFPNTICLFFPTHKYFTKGISGLLCSDEIEVGKEKGNFIKG